MNGFLNVLDDFKEFKTLIEFAKKNKSIVNVVGASEVSKAHIIAGIIKKSGKKACIITAGELFSKSLCEDLNTFLDEETVYFPGGDFILYDALSVSYDLKGVRSAAASKIVTGAVTVMSTAALLGFVMPKNDFLNYTLSLSEGSEYDTEDLIKTLVNSGYKRCHMVEGPGQFSMRGGILDVFPPAAELPFRIEFFGDEIDSIRIFDTVTQVSRDRTDSVMITPGDIDAGNGSIIDYFDHNTLFIFDEPRKVSESAYGVCADIENRVAEFMLAGKITDNKPRLLSYRSIIGKITQNNVMGFSALSQASPDYKPENIVNITTKAMPGYSGNIELMLEDIQSYSDNNYTIFILCGNEKKAERLSGELGQLGKSFQLLNQDEAPPSKVIGVYNTPLRKGFEYPHLKAVFISGSEMGAKAAKKRRLKSDAAKVIRSFDELSEGDFVVHISHGIGRFEQLVKMEVGDVKRDYLKISYKNNDVLYVPVNQLNLLYRYSYVGEEMPAPKVNKLGGSDWQKTKANVKHSVKQLAVKLVELYAERSRQIGHAFSEDTPWQGEFEAEFPYEETADQIRCIEEMKKDMEKPKPMDRLLCGDVGYGKTEVAIRGAFKSVMDGYQCAYLVPTTILASQHYNHFLERMKNYPIKVEMLSRFRTPAKQKQIIKQIKSGEVDIVIGTHRLLGNDIEFKKPGLLIIDEEQRFGVGHKEKIKDLKRGIDVLTLTATPIPRTLNMAMTGIRDMSVLAQPPEERYTVQTYVLEYDDFVIKDAIERELSRGGQVYYVYNRVAGIYRIAENIKKLAPDANVAVAHGRMNENDLENVMMKFLEGETNILVCTTIIETGIDIPNVNTIVIENADCMGLSQLYQLRGRVGRSNRVAYSYFTFRRDKALSEVAEKRLMAIKEFTEFGSGFKIALRDLEIRGAGNLLGPEQHGFMASVGYDMYLNILNEAVAELGGKESKKTEAAIDINITARIPEAYIENSRLRLEAYRMIADIENEDDASEVINILIDRYGDPPEEALVLIDISLLRIYAGEAGIGEIGESCGKQILYFADGAIKNMETVIKVLEKHKGKILLGVSGKPHIALRKGFGTGRELLKNIKILLKDLKEN